jgi:hypothetical protein
LTVSPISLDYEVEKVTIGTTRPVVPKFAKAIMRVAKHIATSRRKLNLVYPSTAFPWTPFVTLEVYFALARSMKSRLSPKVLIVSNTFESAAIYRTIMNEYQTPFVNFVYSGLIDRVGFHRLKAPGSSIGAAQARIGLDQAQVFFTKPSYVDMAIKCNFVLIENVQLMLWPKFLGRLEALLRSDAGIMAVQTTPNPTTLQRLEGLGLLSWGWTEDSLNRQSRKFNDSRALTMQETRFPIMELVEPAMDTKFRSLVELAYNSYMKSAMLRRKSHVESSVIDRVLHESRFYLRRMLSLCVPIEALEKAEAEFGRVVLRRRFAYTRSVLEGLSPRIRESLELESPLNILESLVTMPSPKWAYIKDMVGRSYKRVYLVVPDEVSAIALQTQFDGRGNRPEVIFPSKPQAQPVLEAAVAGLSGSIYSDYRVMKAPNADRCVVLAYPVEREFAQKLQSARASLAELVADRIALANSFK